MRFSLIFLTLLAVILITPQCGFAQMRVTSVADLNLGSWGGVGDAETTDALCMYHSASTTYYVAVTGVGAGGAYVLQRGATNLNINVAFKGSSGSFVALSPGVSQSFSAADTSSSNCGGGTNAEIRVRATEANLRLAPAGSYSGTLSITISPS